MIDSCHHRGGENSPDPTNASFGLLMCLILIASRRPSQASKGHPVNLHADVLGGLSVADPFRNVNQFVALIK